MKKKRKKKKKRTNPAQKKLNVVCVSTVGIMCIHSVNSLKKHRNTPHVIGTLRFSFTQNCISFPAARKMTTSDEDHYIDSSEIEMDDCIRWRVDLKKLSKQMEDKTHIWVRINEKQKFRIEKGESELDICVSYDEALENDFICPEDPWIQLQKDHEELTARQPVPSSDFDYGDTTDFDEIYLHRNTQPALQRACDFATDQDNDNLSEQVGDHFFAEALRQEAYGIQSEGKAVEISKQFAGMKFPVMEPENNTKTGTTVPQED